MRIHRTDCRTACSIVLAAAATPLVAGEGRIPVYAPLSITVPGHYVVTRDLDGAGPLVAIAASGVTLDLDGHTLTAPGGIAAIDVARDAGNVTIGNGTIVATGYGVRYYNSADGNAIRLRLEELTIEGAWVGIFVVNAAASPGTSEHLVVRGCVVAGSKTEGIYVKSNGTGLAPLVTDSTVTGTRYNGIALECDGGVVARNSVADFGARGILVRRGTLVEGNSVSRSVNGTGIVGWSGANRFAGNTVSDCGQDGIVASTGDVVSGNVSNDNGDDGIVAGGQHVLLEDNQIQGNGGCGIQFSGATHAYRDNMLRGNGGGATCGIPATDAGGKHPVRAAAAARRAALLVSLAALPAHAAHYFAVDVPTQLSGSFRLCGDIVLRDTTGYATAASLAPGVAIGALELQAGGAWLFAPVSAVTLGGADHEARDVVRFDGSSYTSVLDGSSAGIPAEARIDALLLDAAPGIVLSFDVPVNLAGVEYGSSDLVRYDGAFSLYWSGAAAGVPSSSNLVGAALDASGLLVLTFDVPTLLSGTNYLPGQLVAFSGSFGSYDLDPSWPAGTQLRDLALSSPAGAVPDGGAVPGVPLTAAKSATDVTLTWGSSCNASDTDYEVQEGTLGSWYSHTAVACSTSGAQTRTLTPGAGSRYFLVVPRNALHEGSYGKSSAGAERPPGTGACAPQMIGACP